LKKIFSLKLDAHVLVVDDSSPDQTGELAERLAAENNRILVLHRRRKEGLGKAYIDGFKYAITHTDAEYIIQMDADLSHDPTYILDFLNKMNDFDVVIGSRFYSSKINIVGWPLQRLVLSYAARIYVMLLTGLKISDPTSGFKCFKRNVIKRLVKRIFFSNGYAFQIEVN
jgi:dolichol-phosphate mannosyltransferase